MSTLPDEQKVRIPSLNAETNATINAHLAEIHRHRYRNLMLTSYYESKRALRQVGTIVPPQYFNLGLTLGWTGKGVDALARRCNLDGFTWDGDLESLGSTELWDDNSWDSETDAAIVSALQHGPAFLINTVGGADEPRSLIHVKDATEATGTWNRRTRRLDDLLSVIERDRETGRVLSLALYLDGETITAQRDGAGAKWQTEVQEHAYGVPVEVLPYRPNPKRPFGQSRITRPMMGLQDAGVRTLIRLEGHMDIYSYPELWMLGADMSIFTNADGTQMDVWAARLGRIKGIPDDDEAAPGLERVDVKQFPASSPEPHLADINALSKLFAREAQLPDSAVAITDYANPTSAESYDASQYELIAEAEGAIRDFSAPLRRSFVRGLAISNSIGEEDIPVEWSSIAPKWRDPRYISHAAQADAGLKQLQAAPELSGTEVGYELLGLSPDQIKRALSDQRRRTGASSLASILERAAAGDSATAAAV